MEKLVKDILSKKELKSLDTEIGKKELETYFKQNENLKDELIDKDFNKRSKEYKQVVKEVRKKLREIYGVFIKKGFEKREKLLEKIKETSGNDKKLIIQLLDLHQSSSERILYYKEIYKKIFEITGTPKTVLDLACGLNPVSYSFMGCNPKYVASDISGKDMKFLSEFFKIKRIDGKTEKIDLINEQEKLNNVKADICFLFKALDSLETIKKNISKELINAINAKWIVISFSKISIGGGKKISKNKRNWILNFIKKKGFFYEEFEIYNEYFIVVKK